MALTYQKVPVTLSPYTVIPDDALPSAGLDDQDAGLVAQLSQDYTVDTAVSVEVSSSGPFVADVVVSAATAPDEPFRINWDFGDGTVEEGADDADQHHTYLQAGAYIIEAEVMQRGEATFTLTAIAAFDDTGTLI